MTDGDNGDENEGWRLWTKLEVTQGDTRATGVVANIISKYGILRVVRYSNYIEVRIGPIRPSWTRLRVSPRFYLVAV